MKLVEILARELDEWPEADSEYGQIESMSQASDYQVSHYAGVRQKWREDLDDWDGSVGDGYVPCSRFTTGQLATDHATAIVTKTDWEAERAKLKAPNANVGVWIRRRGGKCPVDGDTVVDIRCRNGRVHEGEPAFQFIWKHSNDIGDAMAYRIHKPAEQQVIDPSNKQEPDPQDDTKAAAQAAINPLEWRDRIRELDTHRAEVESTYQRQISEITQERESLVQKLAGEGLALVEVVVQPAEDMSDPANWRKGDLITFVEKVSDACFTTGKQYIFEELDGYGSAGVLADDEGDENGWAVEFFKWHSRPAS